MVTITMSLDQNHSSAHQDARPTAENAVVSGLLPSLLIVIVIIVLLLSQEGPGVGLAP